MRTLFFICCLAAATSVSAQKPSTPDSVPKTSLKNLATAGRLWRSLPDTVVTGDDAAPIDRMPNAITAKPVPPVFRGNNGRGFDVYESQLDGMPILMPDSANKASLNYGSVKKVPGVYLVPGSKMYKVPKAGGRREP